VRVKLNLHILSGFKDIAQRRLESTVARLAHANNPRETIASDELEFAFFHGAFYTTNVLDFKQPISGWQDRPRRPHTLRNVRTGYTLT
jgi:hypothetical protein